MNGLDLNSVPAWIAGLNLIFAGFMWLLTRKEEIRIDSSIWGYTYIWIGILFLLSYFDTEVVGLERRVVGSRIFIIVLAISQWFPLTIAFIKIKVRRIIDGYRRNNNGNNRSS